MSSDHQHIKWRRNIAENFNPLSRVHERFRRQTDRQTDGRTTIYSEREDELTFANDTVMNKSGFCSYYLEMGGAFECSACNVKVANEKTRSDVALVAG